MIVSTVRASDQTREPFASALSAGYAQGLLSLDTFSERVDRMLRAGEREELEELIADLPRSRSWTDRARERCDRFVARVEALAAQPRRVVPVLLVEVGAGALEKGYAVLGRSDGCDVVLRAPTISRQHAVVRPRGSSFLLSDLQSTNGTWCNGERVRRAQVAAGQVVWLGEQPLELRASGQRFCAYPKVNA